VIKLGSHKFSSTTSYPYLHYPLYVFIAFLVRFIAFEKKGLHEEFVKTPPMMMM